MSLPGRFHQKTGTVPELASPPDPRDVSRSCNDVGPRSKPVLKVLATHLGHEQHESLSGGELRAIGLTVKARMLKMAAAHATALKRRCIPLSLPQGAIGSSLIARAAD